MNTPRINPDDPKWTAYVLGELSEAERAEIEQLLESSDEARALVDELTLATATLKEELIPLSSFSMTPEQKAAILSAAQPVSQSSGSWFGLFPAKWAWGLAATAAVAVFGVTTLMVVNQDSQEPTRPIAQVAENRVPAEETKAIETAPPQAPVQAARQQEQKLRERADASASQGQSAMGYIVGGNVAAPRKDEKSESLQGAASNAAPPPPAPVQPERALQRTIVTPAVTEQEVRTAQASLPEELRANVGIATQERARREAGPVAAAPPPPAPPAVTAPGRGGGGGGRGGGGGAAAGGRGGVAGGAGPGIAQGQAGVVRDGMVIDDFRAAAAPPPPPAAPPARPASSTFVDNNVRAVPANTEAYDRIVDNPFIRTIQEPLATFSIDVDTASYANVRRFLTQNQMPPRDAVRIEEMINYFSYDYAQPTGDAPIAPNMEVAASPWNPQNRLVRIGIKARDINANRRPPSNLVFLIDVSGSMNTPQKLPLVKAGLRMLVDRLGENDNVSIVVYAGVSGLVLPSTSAIRKERIQQAIDSLQPGGSTNGASGIQLAYNQAVSNFIRGGTNRVILMTDGDFNVGVTNQGELTRLIEDRARSGVFLSVLGFGMSNIKDSTLEKLADQGNGNYAYIDTINEARKVLVEEMGSTLVTIAKDVKIQVDFNPARVEAYRLIGYENRLLRTEDFNNDMKDAGDMGAGHTVTALFEVVPKGGNVPGPSIDPSKYLLDQPQIAAAGAGGRGNANAASAEMLTLRVRYKQPDSDTSTRMDVPFVDRGSTFQRASADFRFAVSVAAFGMVLRDSPYRGNTTLETVSEMAQNSRGSDRNGYRQEFIELVQRARRLR
jgi:Ca-activated chloride channel family protein